MTEGHPYRLMAAMRHTWPIPQARRGSYGATRRRRNSKAFREFSGRVSQKLFDSIDELFGHIDRRAAAVERHVRIRTQPVSTIDLISEVWPGIRAAHDLVLTAQVVKI